MKGVFLFPAAQRDNPEVLDWMQQHDGALGTLAQTWFQVMRDCGPEIRELLHDGHPTACVGEAAFAYVDAFKAHVNVGFYRGAELADPEALLQGTGKMMRHVKLHPGEPIPSRALSQLIETAYRDMRTRLAPE